MKDFGNKHFGLISVMTICGNRQEKGKCTFEFDGVGTILLCFFL